MKNTTDKKNLKRAKMADEQACTMTAYDFNLLAGGIDDEILGSYLGVHRTTVSRYRNGQCVIPGAVSRLMRMRFSDDASLLLGTEWEGFRFGSDGLLYVPGWRRGFDPHELKAMFFRTQHVSHLEATIRRDEERIAHLEQEVIDTTNAFIERPVVDELSAMQASLNSLMARLSKGSPECATMPIRSKHKEQTA